MERPLHALVVAYDFPPHGAIGTQRTLRLVRYLSREGWRVTVLTGDPSTYLASTPVDHGLLAQVPTSVSVIRAPSWRPLTPASQKVSPRRVAKSDASPPAPPAPPSRPTETPQAAGAGSRRPAGRLRRALRLVEAAFGIPDKENGWIVPAFLMTAWRLRGANRPDVMFSSAPPWSGQVLARALKAWLRVPWLADFRDPWARAPWREDRARFVMRAAQHLEHWVVRGTDKLVFVSAANCRDFSSYYGPDVTTRFFVVPNGCDTEEFAALQPMPRDGHFVLLHAGSLYGGRNPVPLIRAIARGIQAGLIDPGTFRFRQVGPCGPASDEILRERARLGLEHVVELVPRVQRQESLREIVSAHALLILQPGTTLAVPGKLYEYFAAGRPILAITEEGETAEIVRRSGGGVVCLPQDEDGMLEGLLRVMDIANAPRDPLPPELYDGRLQAAAVADVLRALATGAGTPVTTVDARLGAGQ